MKGKINENIVFEYFSSHSRFLYPGFLALLVSTLSFPLGPGQFIAGELSTHEQVTQLFSNFTWSRDDLTVEQAAIVTHWVTSYTNIFINLSIYIVFTVSDYRNKILEVFLNCALSLSLSLSFSTTM